MGSQGATAAPHLYTVGDHEVPDGGVVHALGPLYCVINVFDFDRHGKGLAVVRVGVVWVLRIVQLQSQAPVRDFVSKPLQV